jgi:hypothetical protein
MDRAAGHEWLSGNAQQTDDDGDCGRVIIDATHYLDDQGAIAPEKRPARKWAEFVSAVIAAATHPGRETVAPECFKCRKAPVEPEVARDGAVVWVCPHCSTEGRISSRRSSPWDLDLPDATPH